MCYKRPGPRCANFTRKRMVLASKNYGDDPSSGNFKTLQNSIAAHDATAGGQKELEEHITSLSRTSLDADVLNHRLQQGKATFARKKLLLDKKDGKTVPTTSTPKNMTNKKPVQVQPTSQSVADYRVFTDAINESREESFVRDWNISRDERAESGAEHVFHFLKNAQSPSQPYLYSENIGYKSYTSGCSGCEHPYDDYCRCGTYENSGDVDVPEVLAGIFRTEKENVPHELVLWANKNGFDSNDSDVYRVQVSGGYYGEEFEASIAEYKIDELRDLWESAHDA